MNHETKVVPLKAVLVGVVTQGVTEQENEESLVELGRLVTTLGYEVVHKLSQRRASTSGANVLGGGKLAELGKLTGGKGTVEKAAFRKKSKAAERFAEAEQEDEEEPEEDEGSEDTETEKPKVLANVVVFDCELSPSQLANVKRATGVEVLDRTGVIIQIFGRHAKSRIAKLQVEIAKLRYLAPRVREAGGGGDRVGTAGETTLELDRRKIRDRIAELKIESAQLQKEQSSKREQRSESRSVALVGYTNAGKSSLMRVLTGSESLVADKLFATLDTTVRAMQPATVPKILISDTVGFIKKLPHDLVASFRSTLDEAANASLLLFVVDASDANFRAQLQVTEEVLGSIGVENIPRQLILNKIDLLNSNELAALAQEFPEAFALSTRNPDNIAALRDRIVELMEQGMVDQEMFVAYSAQGVVGKLRSSVRVLKERCDNDGITFEVRGFKEDLERLHR
jgi:GTP-binding protein HflX